jgi:hypothetical protein
MFKFRSPLLGLNIILKICKKVHHRTIMGKEDNIFSCTVVGICEGCSIVHFHLPIYSNTMSVFM